MLFNSFSFIIFFTVTLVFHYLPFSWRQRKLNLLLASYLFYAAWNPPFVLIIWLSTATDWFIARRIHRTEPLKKTEISSFIKPFHKFGYPRFF